MLKPFKVSSRRLFFGLGLFICCVKVNDHGVMYDQISVNCERDANTEELKTRLKGKAE